MVCQSTVIRFGKAAFHENPLCVCVCVRTHMHACVVTQWCFCTLEASVGHILHYRAWQTDIPSVNCVVICITSTSTHSLPRYGFIPCEHHCAQRVKLNCYVFQLQAYDPDIRDRTADQHIVFFVVKEYQQKLFEIARNGCLSQIEVSGVYRYLQ